MKPSKIALILRSFSMSVFFMLTTSVFAQSNDWVQVTGADNLQEFMSGLTIERKLPSGELSTGEYLADGTGVSISWGVSYPRTWRVEGNDQICIKAEKAFRCYLYEQNKSDPDLYRARVSTGGDWIEFRASSGQAVVTNPEQKTGLKGSAATPTAAEIAAELSNPNTAMGTLNTNFDFITYDGELPGAEDESALKIVFQPSLPYPLGGGKNFFVRPAIPIIVKQPVPAVKGGFESTDAELGDIGFDASVGFSFETDAGTNVLIAGTAGLIPSATDDAIGLDQWLFGPELGGFMVRKWGAIGIIGSHQWDVAGEDSVDTSITAGQYIYSFNLTKGWQISGSPFWSYNHNADSDDAWTFSVGGGVAKTAIIRGRPWKMSIQYLNFVERADTFAQEHQVRFTIGPVVKLPWKGRG